MLKSRRRKTLTVTYHVLNDKTAYNSRIVHIYDTVKVATKIACHQKEIKRVNKLLKKIA